MIDNIEIVHVVAHDLNNAIGKENKLPWHVPTDLKHFHDITYNGIVIMGRKTYESIGRPLPQRDNIIISRDIKLQPKGALRFGRIDTALAYAISLAKYKNQKQIFIIGGSELYKQTEPTVDKIEATLIKTEIDKPDAFYQVNLKNFSITKETESFDAKSKFGLIFRTYQK